MDGQSATWQERQRARTIALFRSAWAMAPPAGRSALVDAAEAGRVGHRWRTGRGACVLALLVRPALRSGEAPRAGAYRLLGCEVTDDLPATWDGGGVTLTELLGAVGIALPPPRPWWARWTALPVRSHLRSQRATE